MFWRRDDAPASVFPLRSLAELDESEVLELAALRRQVHHEQVRFSFVARFVWYPLLVLALRDDHGIFRCWFCLPVVPWRVRLDRLAN